MKKIKSNFLTVAVLIATIVFISGCSKDWLDVNTDPNNASEASVELVFPSGVVSVASQTGGYYNLVGGFWSQYWSQSNAANQYKYIDQYQINSGDFNRMWREMYSGALSDLNYVIDEAEVNGNWSYYLMGTVSQAYAFAYMVDFFDDIPYSEAFLGNAESPNLSPKFEKGYDVYKDLIIRIDNALSKEFNDLSDAEKKADFVFGGDINKWIQFANTLKLKMYLRMAYSHPSEAEAGVKALYSANAEFLNSDAGLDIFIDAENKDNPLYGANNRKLNVATNLRMSATLYYYFEGNSDPRLSYHMTGGTKPMPQGGFNIPSTQLLPTDVVIYALRATDPVYFISEVESYLLQAEAIIRNWGTGDAKALYDAAITAEFARKGLAGQEVALIAADGVYEYPSEGSFDDQLKAIIMAKWAAFAGSQCTEAFFETNRTGYPEVSSIPSWADGAFNDEYVGGKLTYSLEGTTNAVFPARMIYPQDEVNLNGNFPGQTNVTDKVWWDKN
ncbi:MAG: SusD/RagB family nutrient-binding outer membrane lipoprotein [Bacteroidota bacterium]